MVNSMFFQQLRGLFLGELPLSSVCCVKGLGGLQTLPQLVRRLPCFGILMFR